MWHTGKTWPRGGHTKQVLRRDILRFSLNTEWSGVMLMKLTCGPGSLAPDALRLATGLEATSIPL